MSGERSHDLLPGPVHHCQVCFSERLEPVIDLGHQPLCDSLLTAEQLDQPETSYPLRLVRCVDCSLAQIDYAVPGELVYHPHYPYRCGITAEVVAHHAESSRRLVEQLGLQPGALVVDVGSNDGTLLGQFQRLGMRVVGVEPTNVARIAREAGVETLQACMTEALAREIRGTHGPAKLMTATNVFAHMATLGEVIRGIDQLLDADGVMMTETHSLLDIVERTQYDTIYHEHLRSYSLKSLVTLYELYGFQVFDAERVDRYGGSLRVLAGRRSCPRPVSGNVARILEEERVGGLVDGGCYPAFRERVQRSRSDLLRLVLDARREGLRVVGNSCPGRASTLVNYVGLDRDMMPYIAEQPTSLKLGLHLPGKHMPVVKNEILFREQPDVVILLAWHYAAPIAKDLRARGLRSRLVVPLPEVTVV